ncbi:MAG: Binding-protein-dependent transport systems inner membrane component [Acetothermia bacterium 64_32]|nr:MAG: Binding-protein-dependent transport systems inner membrane component [Acetothermia bacterium 64_32]HAF70265.1 peptide ABC transporter permease [Candidatus Acetothermia bacterium]
MKKTSTLLGTPRFLRALTRHRLGIIGCLIFTLFCLTAVLAPVIAPYDPAKIELRNKFSPPNSYHIFGTDELGRDVFSRLVFGARVSLTVGCLAVGIAVVIGTAVGIISGYFLGWVDMAVQRVIDAVMCFPSLLIIITIAALLEQTSVWHIGLIIGLLSWAGLARLVRAEVLSLREREFVEAARAIGLSPARLIIKHVLPNVMSVIIVAATFGLAGAIITEASLSFLGLGVAPPTPSWGNMLYAARSISTLLSFPWVWLAPGMSISLCVLSINFMGDALRDALDPKHYR